MKVVEVKAPISLLELGSFKDKSISVVCPEEFYRFGNVDIFCDKYGINHFENFEDGLKDLVDIIEKKVRK